MKRMVVLASCLAVILSLAACGKKAEISQTPDQTAATQAATEVSGAETLTTELITEATTEATTGVLTPEAATEATTGELIPEPTTEIKVEEKVPSAQRKNPKEWFKTLAGVVGMPVSEAIEKLGWTEKDVTERDGYVALPLKIYINDTMFQVFLGSFWDDFNVSEVLFRAEFSTNPQKVAKTAMKAVAELDGWVGRNNQLETGGNFALRDTTETEIVDAISLDEYAYSMITWDYSKQAGQLQNDYIKDFAAEVGENGVFGAYLGVNRECQWAGNEVVSDTCMIAISLGIVTVPEG